MASYSGYLMRKDKPNALLDQQCWRCSTAGCKGRASSVISQGVIDIENLVETTPHNKCEPNAARVNAKKHLQSLKIYLTTTTSILPVLSGAELHVRRKRIERHK
jgi:hypothetical protein